MPLGVQPGLVLPDDELVWRFSRASGPGGQHVNTSDTRVSLTFDVARSASLDSALRTRIVNRLAGRLVDGRLTVTASDYRSQWRNREAAAARLAALLRDALRPPAAPRRRTTPSTAARARRVADKRRRGELKAARRPPGPEE